MKVLKAQALTRSDLKNKVEDRSYCKDFVCDLCSEGGATSVDRLITMSTAALPAKMARKSRASAES